MIQPSRASLRTMWRPRKPAPPNTVIRRRSNNPWPSMRASAAALAASWPSPATVPLSSDAGSRQPRQAGDMPGRRCAPSPHGKPIDRPKGRAYLRAVGRGGRRDSSYRRPGGGIGRRAGFRYLWPRGRGSSSLLLGTIDKHIDKSAMTSIGGGVRLDGASIELHRGDLPDGLSFGDVVAVDTEAMGLRSHRDRLCLVQLSAGDGTCHLVQFPPGGGEDGYTAPNLKAL